MIINMGPDRLGRLHCVVDHIAGARKGWDLSACGILLPPGPLGEQMPQYDPAYNGRKCKDCERYAHLKWANGLTASEIRQREKGNNGNGNG